MLKNVLHRIAFMAVALLAMLAAPSALAVTFTVNSTLDQPDDLTMPGTCHTAAGTCTLRAAVMQANRSSGAGATIVLPAGMYTLTIPAAGADGETNGDLNLTTPASGSPPIVITGAGASTTIIDANQLDRVFHVHLNRFATISGVTIRNGFVAAPAVGGGIYNEGSLTLNNTAITGNNASYGGGGIYTKGSSALTNTTISQNNTDNNGGGLSTEGTTTTTNCTFSQNHAGSYGAGIENLGSLTIRSSTVDNNHAQSGGGGIYNDGALFLIDSTISMNAANVDGGGIYNDFRGSTYAYSTSIVYNAADADNNQTGGAGGGIFKNDSTGNVFNLRNTLVAGNDIQNAPVYDECYGTLTSYGRNLFGADFACAVVVGSGSFTTLNSFTTLGPLRNNGGPTLTVALLAGSNAIDGGDPVLGCIDNIGTLATDQRGFARVAGARCDIGAFEFNPVSSPVLTNAVSRRVHGAAGTYDLPLSSVATNPTTEPRIGPSQTIVFTFDKPVSAATATITEGTATAGVPTFSGNNVIVGLTGVTNQQYVTVSLSSVASSDGGTGGSGSVRIGFLVGDVNQNRVVTVADLGLVNAQLAQPVTAANYLKDVNVSGTLTVGDKGMANSNLTKALPTP
jgi:hypothetical protein